MAIGPRSTADLAVAAETVIALSLALPARLAAVGRLGEVLDADQDWLDFLLEPPTGLDGCVSRPDLIYSDGRFQCVDVNAAHAGGWNANALWHRKAPAGVRVRDPLDAVFDLVHRQAVARGVVAPGLPVGAAIVMSADAPEFAPAARSVCLHAWAAAAERLGGPPGPLHFVAYPDLRIRGRTLWCGSDRVHALIEGSVVDGPDRMRCVSLFKNGTLSLHSGPIGAPVNDRRLLAELSRAADAGDSLLNPAERAAVRTCVPWTRPLREAGQALAGRAELVLKRADSADGTGVYIGRFTPAADWADLLRSAVAEGGWVLQRYMSPQLPADADTYHPDTHVVWGAFVVAGRYAGGFVRLLSADGYRAPGTTGAVSVASGPNGDGRIPLSPIGESDPDIHSRGTGAIDLVTRRRRV